MLSGRHAIKDDEIVNDVFTDPCTNWTNDAFSWNPSSSNSDWCQSKF